MLDHRPGLYDLTQRLAMRVENNDLWRTKPRLEAGYFYGVQYSWPLHLVNVTGFEFWTASIHPLVSVRATGRIVRYSLVNAVPILAKNFILVHLNTWNWEFRQPTHGAVASTLNTPVT